MIQISTPVAVTLLLSFLGCVFGFGKLLLGQFEKRMAERLRALDSSQQAEAARIAELGRKVDHLAQLLPLEYVRREDWIRFSAAIDNKLDRLADLVMKIPGGNRARD